MGVVFSDCGRDIVHRLHLGIQRVSNVEDAVGDLEDNLILIVQPGMRFIQVIPKGLQQCSSDGESWQMVLEEQQCWGDSM